MDSKILYVTLLLGVFCLWYTEASPMEEKESYDKEEPPEDTKAAISGHAARVAGKSALAYANKAKATESKAKLSHQLAKDRLYYSREYHRMAEEAKKKSTEYKQLHEAELARIGYHQNKQKDWSSKTREANTQCKTEELKSQEYYSKFREQKRESIMSGVEATMQEAIAESDEKKSERFYEISRDLKRKAENAANEASNHYQRSKEEEAKASAEKIKGHQQAEDSQKHHAAARAYEQDGLKSRMASRANLMKYIESSLLAERASNEAKENDLKSEWLSKVAETLARHCEMSGAIYKILISEADLYKQRSRQYEIKGWEYSESKKMMGSELAESGELLNMAQAKDESPEEEDNYKLAMHPAEDSIKILPSEDKDSMVNANEGMR